MNVLMGEIVRTALRRLIRTFALLGNLQGDGYSGREMKSYHMAAFTLAMTYLLIIVGGIVHATESSLACPDWPLCFGQWMPEMKGKVAIEHGHRLLAAFVGFCTLVVATLVFLEKKPWSLKKWSLIAVVLVVGQGVLGGITVIYKLPTIVSTSHLSTAMAFSCVLVFLVLALRPQDGPAIPSVGRSRLKSPLGFCTRRL